MIPFAIGAVGIGVTVALHAFATNWLIRILKRFSPTLAGTNQFKSPLILSFVAVFFAAKHFLDMLLWAVGYWIFAAGQFDDFQSALYFSSVTYTSLGYGDIVLSGYWRLLCGVQAINGVLLFGWTGALMFVMVQRMWGHEFNSQWKPK